MLPLEWGNSTLFRYMYTKTTHNAQLPWFAKTKGSRSKRQLFNHFIRWHINFRCQFRCKEKKCALLQDLRISTRGYAQSLASSQPSFRVFKKRKKQQQKQALLFALYLFLFSLVVTTLPPCTYFICRGFSRQISCCDAADVVNWANPHEDSHINRR